MKAKVRFLEIAAVVMILSFASCQDESVELISPAQPISVINDQVDLERRVFNGFEFINIISDNPDGRINNDIRLVLVSEVVSPLVDGMQLMATSLDMRNNLIAVSYNVRGSSHLGGVDLMTMDGDVLTLTSQVKIENADVNTTYFDGSKLYFAGAASGSDSTAFVYKLTIKNNVAQSNGAAFKWLGGFTATGVHEYGSFLYVTTGNNEDLGGGLYVKNKKDLSSVAYIPLHDARWVITGKTHVHVQQGTPGNLTLLEKETWKQVGQYAFSGANIAESKSTFDVSGDLVFLAAGLSGVQILNVKTGEKVSEIPLPEGASADQVSNSVTVSGNLIFISNGESVVMAEFNKGNTAHPNPIVLGRLGLGDNQSINHVRYRNNRLVIASGLGGTKVVKVVK